MAYFFSKDLSSMLPYLIAAVILTALIVSLISIWIIRQKKLLEALNEAE